MNKDADCVVEILLVIDLESGSEFCPCAGDEKGVPDTVTAGAGNMLLVVCPEAVSPVKLVWLEGLRVGYSTRSKSDDPAPCDVVAIVEDSTLPAG